MSRFLTALIAGVVAALISLGTQESRAAERLVVGTKEAPPFAMKDEAGKWLGISIELWRAVAETRGLDYDFKEYDLAGLLKALERSEVDVGVAALTMNAEREKLFDFSHPFHTSGLGIAVSQDKKSGLLLVLDRFFSLAFFRVTAVLTLLLLAVGLLVWFFERKHNSEQFGGSPVHGIGSGFWWSAVTMTTVGYGDKAPRTVGGRVVGLLWMFTAIIVISSFTATITTTLTVSQIKSIIRGPEDLHRVAVGSVDLSTSASYLKQHNIAFRHYRSPAEALKGLAAGEVEVVVYDAPILRYLVNQDSGNNLMVLKVFFDKQQYALGLPTQSPLREDLNRLLLAEMSEPGWQELITSYLGE